jgi:hypothetical protein
MLEELTRRARQAATNRRPPCDNQRQTGTAFHAKRVVCITQRKKLPPASTPTITTVQMLYPYSFSVFFPVTYKMTGARISLCARKKSAYAHIHSLTSLHATTTLKVTRSRCMRRCSLPVVEDDPRRRRHARSLSRTSQHSTTVRVSTCCEAVCRANLKKSPKDGRVFNFRVLYDRPHPSMEEPRFTSDPPAVGLEVAAVVRSARAVQKGVMGGQPITHPGTRNGDRASWGHASNDGA